MSNRNRNTVHQLKTRIAKLRKQLAFDQKIKGLVMEEERLLTQLWGGDLHLYNCLNEIQQERVKKLLLEWQEGLYHHSQVYENLVVIYKESNKK